MKDSVVIRAVALSSGHFYPHFIRTLSALSGKVNNILANSWHFPPINSCLPQSTCIHSPFLVCSFLVCSFGESEPICHESVALSPGTKLDNRFYGYSACILCPSYQGKVNQISTNPWHFPLENIDSTSIFAVFSGKVNQIPRICGTFLREYCSYAIPHPHFRGKLSV